MYAEEHHQDRLEGELHSDTNKCLENDRLSLLSFKQENQSDTVACPQLNSHRYAQSKVIISMLKEFEKKLCTLLEQCREERRVVQEHIALCRRGDSYCRRPFDCAYCPDFKFLRIFSAVSNADTLMKKKNEELMSTDMLYTRKWTEFHRSKLEEAIVAIETGKKIQEANQEIENLQKTLEQTKDPERKVIIESKLKCCESLYERSKMTSKDLCPNLETEYDWVSISNGVFRGQFTPEECRAMWHCYLHPKINKTPWTVTEKKRLKELAAKFKYQDWDGIAMKLGTKRSGLQCIVRYFNDKQTFYGGHWSEHENKVLKNAVKQLAVGSNIPWHLVANYLPGRSKKQVWEHWTYTMDPAIKKGAFTKEEDMLLVAAVRKYGKKFDKVAERFPDRTSAQLRHRYTLVLEKPKQHVEWSPQDDALLFKLVKKYGVGEWKEISDHFLCFNRIQVRHHYNVLKRRQALVIPSEEEYETDEEFENWINENKLIAASSNLLYGTHSAVDKDEKRELEKMLLPFKKGAKDVHFTEFIEDCNSYFRFMQSNPYPKETITQSENVEVERKFHWLSCVLHILQARLLISGKDNSLLSHHLLNDTERQIISLLQDHHLVTEKEVTDCKIEAHSVKFTMPLNYITLIGYQSSSLYCESIKKEIAADETKYKGSSHSFEQRLFSLFFWPALASKVEPDISDSESDEEEPTVRKRIPPSRKPKRKWPKRVKTEAEVPQKTKRKYVKSGKYKKERTTEVSEARRSSRIASTHFS